MEIEGGRDHRKDGEMIKGYVDEDNGYFKCEGGN